MKPFTILAIAASLTLGVAGAPLSASAESASTPLVSSKWLKDNLEKDGLVVLDIRSQLAGASAEVFQQAHIPGAVYSDYLKDGWRTTNANGTPGVLPPVDQLETLFSRLGIEEDSHVVVVGGGKTALDMGSAARVYWTLKVAGHDRVSILDGGFADWKASPGFPLATGVSVPEPTFYEVELREDLLATKGEVEAALESGITIVDNRPRKQFNGSGKHPAAKRAGTIPGALNVPESEFTRNGGGHFRSVAELETLFATAGVSTRDSQISFCNTGHWASLGWFVSHEVLGNKQAQMYDGSLVEWSADPAAPMTPGTERLAETKPES